MKKVILFLILSVFVLQGSFAQKVKKSKKVVLAGFVKDVYGQPISKATIVIPHSKKTKLTNRKGFYKIKIDPSVNKVLAITNNAFKEMVYHGEPSLSFVLSISKDDSFNEIELDMLEENLSDGEYQVDIKLEDSNDYLLLQGRKVYSQKYHSLSELFRQEMKQEGYGPSSYGLFIVDNIEYSGYDLVRYINPTDIKSIKVLELGPAWHIYGRRGTRGVCIIKTKSALANNIKD